MLAEEAHFYSHEEYFALEEQADYKSEYWRQVYWTLLSLEEYVLIDQYRMRVEYFKRVSNKEWRLLIFSNSDEVLTLNSVDVEIPLSEIYLNVTWDEE